MLFEKQSHRRAPGWPKSFRDWLKRFESQRKYRLTAENREAMRLHQGQPHLRRSIAMSPRLHRCLLVGSRFVRTGILRPTKHHRCCTIENPILQTNRVDRGCSWLRFPLASRKLHEPTATVDSVASPMRVFRNGTHPCFMLSASCGDER